MLLREMADERVGRAPGEAARERGVGPGEQSQQGRLPGAVGADDPEDVTGADGEVDPLEQGAVAVAAGEAVGDESSGPRSILPPREDARGRGQAVPWAG